MTKPINKLHARFAERRMPRQGNAPAKPDPADQIARINELTQTARASWFGLLAYLAFVGVTLLGVEDADFFIAERQTALPLIGVSVPTFLFFKVAPILGAALFAYHHLHLLKLWEALTRAPAKINHRPLSDHIKPWLVNDLALGYRPGRALRPRPMRLLAHWVSLALVFLATPLVLFFFWLWSMPAHDELVTVVFCGAPLLLSVYVAAHSWWRMRRITDRKRKPRQWRLDRWLPLWLIVSFIGWCTTEGTLDAYMRYYGMDDEAIEQSAWSGDIFPFLLARADLAGVDFVNIPEGWRDHDTAKAAFHQKWCKARNIPALACHIADDTDDKYRALAQEQRHRWCEKNTEQDCDTVFADFDINWTTAWTSHRTDAVNELAARSLSRRDLRNANLVGARMEGAILSSARMEGADLRDVGLEGANLHAVQMQGAILYDARLERATLSRALLQGADFSRARLQRADFRGAKMRGATLSLARMEGAYFSGAWMQGVDLSGAWMQGADLSRARMQRADLSLARLQDVNFILARMQSVILGGTQFNGKTDIRGAALHHAAVKWADFGKVTFTQSQVNSLFGDKSVILAADIQRPEHWPGEDLDYGDFIDQWRTWQVENGYTAQPPAE